MKKLIVFLLLIMVSQAMPLTLAWDANTENDLAGYKIYWGPESRNYSNMIQLGLVTSYQIDNDLDINQDHYFAVTAYDLAGNESEYSDELFYNSEYYNNTIDSIWYFDSQICVKIETPVTNFSWSLWLKISEQEWNLTETQNEACLLLPIQDNWNTGEFKLEVFDRDGNTVLLKTGVFNIPMAGDWDGDGMVRLVDFTEFEKAYRNPNRYRYSFDFNRDGLITLYDFIEFAQRYGREKN